MRRGSWWFGLVLVAVAAGCTDPVAEQRVDSLGPEPGTYPQGPNHRPGQPCTWCHGEGGGEEPFDLAGTVFLRTGSKQPAPAVRVRIFDRQGREHSKLTSESGNFFFAEGELELDYPLWVKIEGGGQVRSMRTPIYRESSCAGCHGESASPSSAGVVYLEEDP